MNCIDTSLPHYHRHQSKYLHLILHSFWPSILQLIHSSLQLSNFPLIGHSATHQSTHQSSLIHSPNLTPTNKQTNKQTPTNQPNPFPSLPSILYFKSSILYILYFCYFQLIPPLFLYIYTSRANILSVMLRDDTPSATI